MRTATAERLRFVDADLRAKAEAVENEEDFQPHVHQGNGFAGLNGANGRE